MTNFNACPQEFIDLANELADAAAPIARLYFRSDLRIDRKSDASPVTIADREIESAMRELITERFPDHGIFGEEHGAENIDSDFVWVLDPIDGTGAFITGMPIFGTLIALLHREQPILGIIDMPMLRERWIGALGQRTTLNKEVCAVRPASSLSDASVYTFSPDSFDRPDLERFDRVRKVARTVRYGGDCYSYALLASGHVDVVIDANMKPYDYCALLAPIQAAGGKITDWYGQPLDLNSDGHVLACASEELHAEVQKILMA
jgi:inositol-phosphate phosphatase/L-galactose 1-phosphate phosphatase/histidinol-phosphatase